MKRALFCFSLLMPLIGVIIYFFRPQLKDQVLESVIHLADVLNNSFQQFDKPSTTGKCLKPGELLFSPSSLAHYDGNSDGQKIYLAFLGIVYDVSKGARHYGSGGGYSFFAGKDASKAFITGQFDQEGLTDDVTDLQLDSYTDIKMWQEFYNAEYPRIGKVIGTYYDGEGCSTSAVDHVNKMLEKHEESEAEKSKDNELFPLCNSEFHKETDYHRVWCTDMSGGIKRPWVGVPRQLYLPKEKSYRCACVRNSGPPTVPTIEYVDESDQSDDKRVNARSEENIGDLGNPRIKEYPGCDPKSAECLLSKGRS